MTSPIRTRACALFVVALVVFAAACGGGGGKKAPVERSIRGPHFVFTAPYDWTVTRNERQVAIAPEPKAVELVSVSVFPLVRAYRPSLFPKVVGELDRAAGELAKGLGGKVESSKTVVVAGIRSRQYDLAYAKGGHDYRQRITFVLLGKTEYQLLCRWSVPGDPLVACGRLTETFRPV